LVIVKAFIASLPKKVFEHFSRGIIHKNEIYVYLFMAFTIFLFIVFAINCQYFF